MGFENIKNNTKEQPKRQLTEAELFLVGKDPSAKRILEQFTAEDIMKLEKDTKSASGGGFSFNDLPGLFKRVTVPLVINWQDLAELIKRWKQARSGEKQNATYDEIYKADEIRFKIAKQISALLEDA